MTLLIIAVTTTTAVYSCWGHAAAIFAGDVAVCDSKQGHPDGTSASIAAVWGKGSAITAATLSCCLNNCFSWQGAGGKKPAIPIGNPFFPGKKERI